MLLYYGWSPRYPIGIPGSCFYQMRRSVDGVHLLIDQPHTFNDRIIAACTRANSVAANLFDRGIKPDGGTLLSEALKVLGYYNDYYMSVPYEFRKKLTETVTNHCLALASPTPNHTFPDLPSIEEPPPEEFIPPLYDENGDPIERVLKWDDFVIDSTTPGQYEQRREINAKRNLDTVTQKWQELSLGDGEYTNAELLQHFSSKCLAKARKEGIIVETRHVGRTKYWKLKL